MFTDFLPELIEVAEILRPRMSAARKRYLDDTLNRLGPIEGLAWLESFTRDMLAEGFMVASEDIDSLLGRLPDAAEARLDALVVFASFLIVAAANEMTDIFDTV